MPHVFVNRARYHAPVVKRVAGGVAATAEQHHQHAGMHVSWEVVNATAYQVGGFIFIAGSVLFLPKYEEHVNVGSWLYVAGSMLYLLVSGHDLMEVTRVVSHLRDQKQQTDTATTADANSNNKKTGPLLSSSTADYSPFSEDWNISLDLASAMLYFSGTILFIVGSLLFLPSVGKFKVAAWTFILGSLLFIVGAVVNAIQIFSSPNLRLACFANLTAVSYVIGSTLFLTGSVPYLFDFGNEDDARVVYDYLGWQFIVGSIAFTVGGAWNWVRFYASAAHHKERAIAAMTPPSATATGMSA